MTKAEIIANGCEYKFPCPNREYIDYMNIGDQREFVIKEFCRLPSPLGYIPVIIMQNKLQVQCSDEQYKIARYGDKVLVEVIFTNGRKEFKLLDVIVQNKGE